MNRKKLVITISASVVAVLVIAITIFVCINNNSKQNNLENISSDISSVEEVSSEESSSEEASLQEVSSIEEVSSEEIISSEEEKVSSIVEINNDKVVSAAPVQQPNNNTTTTNPVTSQPTVSKVPVQTKPVVTYTTTVVAPTCEEKGYTLHKGSDGSSFKDTFVDPLGHDFTEWTIAIAPTTTNMGLEQRTCNRCGMVQKRNIDMLPTPTVEAPPPEPAAPSQETPITITDTQRYIDEFGDSIELLASGGSNNLKRKGYYINDTTKTIIDNNLKYQPTSKGILVCWISDNGAKNEVLLEIPADTSTQLHPFIKIKILSTKYGDYQLIVGNKDI